MSLRGISRTASVLAAGSQPPTVETLEDRLLLAAVPVFLDDLTDQQTTDTGAVTIGINAYDEDGDTLTITAVGDDADVVCYVPAGNSFARLYFEDADGDPMGEIVFELFEGRMPDAAQRFIDLATNAVLPDGTLFPAGPPFYTDVVVHRVIDDFMIQTGDAVSGDGTGSSPLPDLTDYFDPDLTFAGVGAVAYANSGANTSNCQFFVTEVPTRWLDGSYMIFGQMISGWDVYNEMMALPTGANDRPLEPPYLASVEIFDGDQLGSVTIIPTNGFAGQSEITVTLDDGNGNQTQQTFTFTNLGERPIIDEIPDVQVTSGTTATFIAPVFDDGSAPLDYSVTSEYAGATLSVDDATGEVSVTVPADFAGIFRATLSVVEEGDDTLEPTERDFYVIAEGAGADVLSAVSRIPSVDEMLAMESVRVGDLLYVCAGDAGLRVYDVSDPENPELLGAADTTGFARAVEVVGDTAFVADTGGGFLAFDVTDPTDIQPYDLPEGSNLFAWEFFIVGDVAFVTEHDYGLSAYDISDPANMVRMSTLRAVSPGFDLAYAMDVIVVGRYAFMTDLAGGLAVIDVSDPYNMRYVNGVGTAGNPFGMDLVGNTLYVANMGGGLLTYDVSRPTRPRLLGQLALDEATHIRVVNEIAIVGTLSEYVFVDVSDPRHPVAEYTFTVPTVENGSYVGRPSTDGTQVMLPLNEFGLGLFDAAGMVTRNTVHGRETMTDGAGTSISLYASGAVVKVYTDAETGDIDRIVVDADASGRGRVRIVSREGITVGEIEINGSLMSFDARTTDLLTDMTVTGGLGSLALQDVQAEHTIQIGLSDNPRLTLRASFNEVSDLALLSDTPIGSLTVADWSAGGAFEDRIVTPYIGRLTSRGGFAADLTLAGTGARRSVALASARILGDLDGVEWDITGAMGRLTVGGTARDSRVTTTMDMAGLTFGAVDGSDFLAGCPGVAGRSAAAHDDFDTDVLATIRSIRVTGLGWGAAGDFFMDSNFSAATIGTVSLLNADFANLGAGGQEFGFYAYDQGTDREVRRLTHRDTRTGERWSWTPASGAFDHPEMVVRIL